MSEVFNLQSVPLKKECSRSDVGEIIYQNPTHRNSEVKYIVELPLRNDFELGNSIVQTFKAFYALEN